MRRQVYPPPLAAAWPIEPVYDPVACPRGCPGAVRWLFEMTTQRGYHLRVYETVHWGKPIRYSMVGGRGWNRKAARYDGRRNVDCWFLAQHKEEAL